MAGQLELLIEADRRGILPADKKVLLDEAKRRGLVPGVQQEAAAPPVQDPQAPPEPKPSGINRASGALDAALQGATFGFSDEMIAGTRAALESGVNLVRGKDAALSENYDKALAYERERLKSFGDENPILSTGANIAGGFASVGPAIAAVRGSGLAGGLAKSAGAGAGYGALGGFGAGEGGLENRLDSAVTGGAAGAVLGAAIPAAGAVASKGVELGRNMLGANNARDVALDVLNRGLTRDQVTPDQVAARLAATEKPMSIMDVAGDNMFRQARLAETTPGPGSNMVKDFLHERQRGQVDRVAENIESHIAQGDNFYLSLEELNKVRKQQAAPLYDAAYEKPFVWNDRIGNLLNRPAPRQALGRAYRIAAEEGRDPRGLGLNLDADGNVQIDKTAASMQTLDYVKRGLDDVLEEFRDKTTGKLRLDENGRSINATREQFLATIDKMNPTYAKARQAWGGPTQTMEAMSLGRQFAKGDAEATIDRFRKLNEADQDAFRIGLARELAGSVQMSRDGRNSVDKIFGSQGQRNRLRQLFPSKDEFSAFEKAMQEEQRMATTKNEVLANSKTLRNTVDANDAGGVIGQAMVDASSGGLFGMAMGFARRAVNRATIGMAEKPAAELASMIATSDRDTQAQVLKELVRRQQKMEASANRGAGLRTAPAAAAANLTGQAAAEARNRQAPGGGAQ